MQRHTRKSQTFAPIKCLGCGKEIELGQVYLSKGANRDWHESCYNNKQSNENS
jgi:hypothetical protein